MTTQFEDHQAITKTIDWLKWMEREGAAEQGCNPESFKKIRLGMESYISASNGEVSETAQPVITFNHIDGGYEFI